LRSIQVLRGVAACGVALMHARYWADNAGPYESWTRIGAAGVDLFFVISGFIMATIPKPSVKEFAFDRFGASTRCGGSPFYRGCCSSPPPPLSASRWSPSGQSRTWRGAVPSNPLDALVRAAVLRGRRLLRSERADAPTGAVRPCPCLPGCGPGTLHFNFFGNPMIFEFLFGVIVAKLPRSALVGRFVLPVAVLLLAIAPLDLFLVKLALTPSASWIRVLMWGFPAALIVYAALSNESLFQHRAVMPFVVLGDASYSIYLFHPLATTVLHLPWPVEFVLAVSLGVGAWWLIERRLLAAKRRFAGLPVRTARPWTTQPLQR
jgi:exopolysaccharide production protein ExoZ